MTNYYIIPSNITKRNRRTFYIYKLNNKTKSLIFVLEGNYQPATNRGLSTEAAQALVDSGKETVKNWTTSSYFDDIKASFTLQELWSPIR